MKLQSIIQNEKKLLTWYQKRLIHVFLGWNLKKNILICLKWAPSNFGQKQKILNLGLKLPDLRKLGLDFENTGVIFEISTYELIKSEIWINTVILVNGVAFSEGSGSSFSEGPIVGPYPLCKVCLIYMLGR